jgi:hypothetical protein
MGAHALLFLLWRRPWHIRLSYRFSPLCCCSVGIGVVVILGLHAPTGTSHSCSVEMTLQHTPCFPRQMTPPPPSLSLSRSLPLPLPPPLLLSRSLSLRPFAVWRARAGDGRRPGHHRGMDHGNMEGVLPASLANLTKLAGLYAQRCAVLLPATPAALTPHAPHTSLSIARCAATALQRPVQQQALRPTARAAVRPVHRRLLHCGCIQYPEQPLRVPPAAGTCPPLVAAALRAREGGGGTPTHAHTPLTTDEPAAGCPVCVCLACLCLLLCGRPPRRPLHHDATQGADTCGPASGCSAITCT